MKKKKVCVQCVLFGGTPTHTLLFLMMALAASSTSTQV
jgi:hypothetical protein